MKLRASNIVLGAVSRALEGAIPYAVQRWYKHRPRCAASTLLDSREFQEHLRSAAYDAVTAELAEVLDLDGATPDDEVPRFPLAALVVYRGGAGWRWILVRGQNRTLATSPYFPTKDAALEDARWLAGITNLPVEVSDPHPEAA